MTFPFLTALAPSFDDKPIELIEATFRHILAARRESGLKDAKDFVDILNEIWARIESPEFQRIRVNEATVLAQAINFFLGGYETSSTTLSHLLYFLALHPECQERVHEEIRTTFTTAGSPVNHDGIREERTPYLTAVLNETLRLAPPILRPERICTKDWEHDEIRIFKGTEVYFPLWAAHRNPTHFPDPEKFRPDRFLAGEREDLHPFAMGAFGHGPRNCIGSRFAYDSIKVFLIHLLSNFRVERRADTVINYKPGSTLLVVFDPLFLDLSPR